MIKGIILSGMIKNEIIYLSLTRTEKLHIKIMKGNPALFILDEYLFLYVNSCVINGSSHENDNSFLIKEVQLWHEGGRTVCPWLSSAAKEPCACLSQVVLSRKEKEALEARGKGRKREIKRWTHWAGRNILIWRTPDHMHIWEKKVHCLLTAWCSWNRKTDEDLECCSLFSKLFPDK